MIQPALGIFCRNENDALCGTLWGEDMADENKRDFPLVSMIVLLTVCTVSCSRFPYAGDGTFHDLGWNAHGPRYFISFSPHILLDSEECVFRLGRLPCSRLTVGFLGRFQSSEEAEHMRKQRGNHSVVCLEIEDTTSGDVLVLKEGNLSEWNWGGLPPYRHDVFVSDDSSFEPKSGHEYLLRLRVLRGDPDGVPLLLMIRSPSQIALSWRGCL